MSDELPKDHVIISEGKASIVFPDKNTVFYNKVQVFNRDLSILAIRTFMARLKKEQIAKHEKKAGRIKARQEADAEKGLPFNDYGFDPNYNFEGIKIFEAMSASGLRSIRYFKEIPDVKEIFVNDLEPEAIETIKRNIAYNKLPDCVKPSLGDCNLNMMLHTNAKKHFEVVDLDPYGSAAMFVDSAVQSATEGGLLAVTCTDKAVLCGNNCEAAYAKYGSMPLRGSFCHDQAVRMVLNCVERAAAKYKRYIVPMVSMSIDFYVRVFVRVYSSAKEAKLSASKQMMAYVCTQCGTYTCSKVGHVRQAGNSIKYAPGFGPPVDQKCDNCEGKHRVGGPFWGESMHDPTFVQEMLDHLNANKGDFATYARLRGNLTCVRDELTVPFMIDVPVNDL